MKKKFKPFSKKKDLIYLSSIKTKLAINFLKKKLLYLAENRLGAEGVNISILCSRAIDFLVSFLPGGASFQLRSHFGAMMHNNH